MYEDEDLSVPHADLTSVAVTEYKYRYHL